MPPGETEGDASMQRCQRRAVALVMPAYERCLAALETCRTTHEVREIRDRATAMRAYARQAKDRRLEADAFEIRSRAERRLGELLLAQKATVGFAKGGQPYQATRSKKAQIELPAPTLADASIDRTAFGIGTGDSGQSLDKLVTLNFAFDAVGKPGA